MWRRVVYLITNIKNVIAALLFAFLLAALIFDLLGFADLEADCPACMKMFDRLISPAFAADYVAEPEAWSARVRFSSEGASATFIVF